MTLWEVIKKGAEEGLEAMRDGLAAFLSEAGRTSRIVKKRVELTAVQANVRKAFILLGSRAYDLHARQEKDPYRNEEVQNLIAQIDGYQVRVRAIEEEIEAIKREEERKKSARGEKASPLNGKA